MSYPYSTLRHSDLVAGGELKLIMGKKPSKWGSRMFAEDGGLTLHWSIIRNLKLWTGTYSMSATAVKGENAQSYLMPEDGNHITLPDNETFGIISGSAFADLKKRGEFIYNGVVWRCTGTGESSFGHTFEVEDPEEGARMTILDDPKLPLILSMQGNPLEIDWTIR